MKTVLLELAKQAIQSDFDKTICFDTQTLSQNYPFLAKEGACFVTLSQKGELRGCIGSIIAKRSLLEDVIDNAKAAAFSDFRFPRLTEEELTYTDIEVSLLSPPKLLEYTNVEELKEKVKPFYHGVIIRSQDKQAVFLPQVWEQLPRFENFFQALGEKAGLGSAVLELLPEVFLFEVEKISQ